MKHLLYWAMSVVVALGINQHGGVDSTSLLVTNSLVGGTAIFAIGYFLNKVAVWEK